MGTKRRIYQVAKEFDLSVEHLIQYLTKSGFDVRNQMTPMTDTMYEEVCKKFERQVTKVDDDYEFRKKLKEKKIQEETKKLEEQKRLKQRLQAATEFSMYRPKIKHEAKEIGHEQKVSPAKSGSKFISDISEEITRKSDGEVIEKKRIDSKKIEKDVFTEVKKEKTKPKKKVKTETVEKSQKAIPGKISAKYKSDQAFASIKAKIDLEEKSIAKTFKAKPPKVEDTSEFPKARTKIPSMPTDKTPDVTKIGKKEEKAESTKEPPEKAKPTETEIEELSDEKKKRRRRRKRKKKKTDEKIYVPLEEFEESDSVEFEEYDVKSEKKTRKKHHHRKEDDLEGVHGDKKREKVKRKKKRKKAKISDAEVEESIRQTFAIMDDTAKTKKRRKKIKEKEIDPAEKDKKIIKVSEFISAAELATYLNLESNEVIKKCFELGMMVSINQRLDMDVIEAVADEFGYSVESLPDYGEDLFEEIEEKDHEGLAKERSPVVTIMGHVDHGKTSLLDYIRESNIIAGEAGGITQHIGAYEVAVNSKAITFLDTPGHEAFTAMRARGAQITDIVVLIVAADDAVMPQTVEAINHAKEAGVPIIVAINKMDKPNANAELIKKQLAEHNVLIEEWGGKYQSVEISAKLGDGVDKLLELILLEAEILELKANANRLARGVVLEAQLDKGKGVVATVLVQKGTLRIGDPFISGQYSGKVRNLIDERNRRVTAAPPSTPVQVVGFTGMPTAGDSFIVLESEKDTRLISFKRQQLKREQEMRRVRHLTLDEISQRIKHGGVKELSIIVKGDMDGSVQAISDSLMKLSNKEVAVNVIHRGVGAISESDVLLASASNAIIIGFQVRPTIKAREIAHREKVDIRLYTIIYDAISEVRDALEGLLEPELKEEILGTVEVRAIFRIPKVGAVAGCYVVKGKIARNDKVKLYRDDKLIYDGHVESLKRMKDDVKEVSAGFECGIGLDGFDDIKINDIIEPYRSVRVKRTLSPA